MSDRQYKVKAVSALCTFDLDIEVANENEALDHLIRLAAKAHLPPRSTFTLTRPGGEVVDVSKAVAPHLAAAI